MTPLIRLDGLWKKFRRGEVHDSLRDLIPSLVKRAFGHRPPADRLVGDEFWALRDLTLRVEPGQTLGVIGPNGAGKSTVLKILTRILLPTRGSYVVQGRVGALIEVAAGFHPDLSGRENIFLQGAIMGMSHAQTTRKLDEIIAFSGIEEFIDTPVKRYSSGMNARLGFSIAAHLDPDVLVLDEVLAVGDYTFQRKAFDRIRELARSGMPVVVVSHQLDRIAELCTHAVLLNRGEVACSGTPADVIGAYMRGTSVAAGAANNSPVNLTSAEFLGPNSVLSGEPVRFRVMGESRGPLPKHVEPVAVVVRSAQTGNLVFATAASMLGVENLTGHFAIDVELQMNVQPGIYLIDLGVWNRADETQLMAGPSLNVRVAESQPFFGDINLGPTMTLVSNQPRLVCAQRGR